MKRRKLYHFYSFYLDTFPLTCAVSRAVDQNISAEAVAVAGAVTAEAGVSGMMFEGHMFEMIVVTAVDRTEVLEINILILSCFLDFVSLLFVIFFFSDPGSV